MSISDVEIEVNSDDNHKNSTSDGDDNDAFDYDNIDNTKETEEREEDGEEYVVEKILDKRYNRKKKRVEYLIKWTGYDSESENTWEPIENCKSASDAIREFEENLKKIHVTRSSKRIVKKSSSSEYEKCKLPDHASKRKRKKLETKFPSEVESEGQSDEEIKSSCVEIDCILGVKKENDKIMALVRFEDGHYDIISTEILVNKCPKRLVHYYENLLQFSSTEETSRNASTEINALS